MLPEKNIRIVIEDLNEILPAKSKYGLKIDNIKNIGPDFIRIDLSPQKSKKPYIHSYEEYLRDVLKQLFFPKDYHKLKVRHSPIPGNNFSGGWRVYIVGCGMLPRGRQFIEDFYLYFREFKLSSINSQRFTNIKNASLTSSNTQGVRITIEIPNLTALQEFNSHYHKSILEPLERKYDFTFKRTNYVSKKQEASIVFYFTEIKKAKKSRIQTPFRINDYLELRFEHDETNIYVGKEKKERFRQCKYLLLNLPKTDHKIEEIDSIDEAAQYYSNEAERDTTIIDPETEFIGHCSNIQAWYFYDYDTRLLHSNIAFPLLRELSRAGEPLAKKALNEEIVLRLKSGHPTVVKYIFELLFDGDPLVTAFLSLDDLCSIYKSYSEAGQLAYFKLFIKFLYSYFLELKHHLAGDFQKELEEKIYSFGNIINESNILAKRENIDHFLFDLFDALAPKSSSGIENVFYFRNLKKRISQFLSLLNLNHPFFLLLLSLLKISMNDTFSLEFKSRTISLIYFAYKPSTSKYVYHIYYNFWKPNEYRHFYYFTKPHPREKNREYLKFGLYKEILYVKNEIILEIINLFPAFQNLNEISIEIRTNLRKEFLTNARTLRLSITSKELNSLYSISFSLWEEDFFFKDIMGKARYKTLDLFDFMEE